MKRPQQRKGIKLSVGVRSLSRPLANWLGWTLEVSPMILFACFLMGFGSNWGFKSAPKIGRMHPSEIAPVLRNGFGSFIALATLACSGVGMVVYTIWALSRFPGPWYLKILAILLGQVLSSFLWNRIRHSGSAFIYTTDHILGMVLYWITGAASIYISR